MDKRHKKKKGRKLDKVKEELIKKINVTKSKPVYL